MRAPGDIVLASTYELGHQPFAIALAGGFLERAGFAPAYLDVAVEPADDARFAKAKLVAISVPMHTALRLGAELAARVRRVNPGARVGFFGLYAPLNGEELARAGAEFVLGGECEALLVEVAETMERGGDLAPYRQATAVEGSRERLAFPMPSRGTLPPLSRYARLIDGERSALAGHVEASRGCLHLCRHCPIPPVYRGRFFVVPAEVVLADVAAQVAAGARHVTFGDPDFLNGPSHSLRIVRAMHAAHPDVTFDFTAKVEHLLRHAALLPELRALGCAFVVSAIESLSDVVLDKLAKGHVRADVERLVDAMDAAGLPLRPSLVSFTPWTTLEDFRDVLRFVERRSMIDCVDPVHFSIRLLVPPGSRLLEPDVRALVGPVLPGTFTHAWKHPDPAMDALYEAVAARVEQDARVEADAAATFAAIKGLAGLEPSVTSTRRRVPRLSESWFCCAEPTGAQLGKVGAKRLTIVG